jgi:capsular exopolysaccharide synthesis family protein
VTRETLRPIWSYKWWLLLFVIAAAAGGYYLSSRQANTYEATASVQLQSGLQASGQFIDQNTLLQLANTYQSLAGTDAVVQLAIQYLPAQSTRTPTSTTTTLPPGSTSSTVAVPQQPTALQQRIKNSVTISQENQVTVLDFVADTGSPQTAQQYAQAYADAFVQYVTTYQAQQRNAALNRIAAQVSQIEVQLRAIPVNINPNAPEDPARTALTTELTALQNQAATQQGMPRDTATLVQPATVPTSAISPVPKRDAALAGLGALIVGLVLVYLRVALTDQYDSGEEASEDLNLPLLAEVPRLGNRPEIRIEAFRALRASVLFALRDRSSVVVLVTSAEEAAGKTFVTINLATSLALEGRKVLAADADLRRPTLHKVTDLPAAPGLANILHGWLADLPVQPVTVVDGVTVDVMPAGLLSRETSELFSRERIEVVIAGLRERYEAVIFDSPPVGAVADAATIAGRGTDGVIFVVNARRTHQRYARRAVQTLRALEVTLLGIVYNGSSARGARYPQRYAARRRWVRT